MTAQCIYHLVLLHHGHLILHIKNIKISKMYVFDSKRLFHAHENMFAKVLMNGIFSE
ncbi:hypothetical protein X975_06079, partial [Stegodyphus mimosarum]